VPALATAYGVTVAQLAPFLGPASQYFGATKAKAKAKAETPDTIAPGKRVALVVAKPTKVAKATKPSTPATKRAYNKLTRVPLPVREFVRGLVTDVNVRIMQGETEMLVAPMPMPLVRDFLGEYLKAKGIDATGLLLDPAFAKQFGYCKGRCLRRRVGSAARSSTARRRSRAACRSPATCRYACTARRSRSTRRTACDA
jgi:hypothetical protein